MSGGSFNYLCNKDAGELTRSLHGDLSAMIDSLSRIPNSDDAFIQSLLVKAILMKAINQVDYILDKNGLRDAWQSVEWYCSGDSGMDDVAQALKDFSARLLINREAGK